MPHGAESWPRGPGVRRQLWLATIAGSPIAAGGDDAADAIDELIDALREYAEDWRTRLRLATNHEQNWGLVQLTDHASDGELRVWMLGG